MRTVAVAPEQEKIERLLLLVAYTQGQSAAVAPILIYGIKVAVGLSGQ